MTTTQSLSLVNILAHHGVCAPDAEYPTMVDAARERGVVLACHGCGTVIIAPEGLTTEQYHAEQPWVREVMESGEWDCCENADTTVF